MAETFRQRIARWIAGAPTARPAAAAQGRLYAGGANTRFTSGFGAGGDTSADAALAADLTTLRARSRHAARDIAYARRARTLVMNNVIGGGIGLQAQVMRRRYNPAREELDAEINSAIESAWREWSRAENCHTGAALHFDDLERMAIGQVFEAGEILLRKHYRPFGPQGVPLALEVIEPERLICDWSNTYPLAAAGNQVRLGVEVDGFQRAVAYYLRAHPGDTRWGLAQAGRVERVPADQIFHLRVLHRWPQTRGEPWMHAVLTKLNDMGDYSASELQAARASSYYFGTIESDSETNPLAAPPPDDPTAAPEVNIQSGVVQQLAPGEKLNFHSPDRPNAAMDPFMRHMLREVAAGLDVSYEELSRDMSQTNYSSARQGMLSDRDLWRVLQAWWIRSFREPLHREWLRLAVLSGAIPAITPEAFIADFKRFEPVRWKPRGWSWVDPVKEVTALKEAVKAGFTTITDVIAATGGGQDIEDVIAARRRELDMLEAADIEVDTTVADAPETAAPPPDPPPPDGEATDTTDEPPMRLVSFGRSAHG